MGSNLVNTAACPPRACRHALIVAASLFVTHAFGQHEHHGAARGGTDAGAAWTALPTLNVHAPRAPAAPIRVAAGGGNFTALTLQTPAAPAPRKVAVERPGAWQIARAEAGSGGHLWLVATQEEAGRTVRASSHLFLPMQHQVPTRMLAQTRPGLELVPLRLPEHGGIREGSTWRFRVRFDGAPLAAAEVVFETAGGSRQRLTADADGIVAVTFPHDFRDDNLDPARPMASRQDFVLAARHSAAGHEHLSAYNHHYFPDRMRERSLGGGIAALAAGMLLAAPLLRRKEKTHA